MSKQSKMTGADYLLLLLYLDNCSAINGAIRITKMMFLFNMEIVPVLKKKGVSICDEDLPKFSAYNYGPFSKDVYEQVELFQSIGFIKVKNLYATEEMSEVDDWEESAFETEFSEGSCQYSSNQDGKFMQYKLLNLGKKYVESEASVDKGTHACGRGWNAACGVIVLDLRQQACVLCLAGDAPAVPASPSEFFAADKRRLARQTRQVG